MKTATLVFEETENLKGWEGVAQYCDPDATFEAQAEPIANLKSMEGTVCWKLTFF